MSDKNDGFKVDAQGYGLGNYIKQYVSPQGARRALTESVSPKYEERMETLRDADKGMRETAGNLKGYLANAQKAFKDNRYLDVAHWCAQIDGGVRAMLTEGKPVVDLRDAEIAEFYTRFEDAEPDHDYFASADDGLIATAGILDNLFGNSIEKLYWKKVKESKLAVQSLIKKAEKLIAIVLSCLGRMGDARAKGNISGWIEELQRIGKSHSEFQIFARGIYDKHLKQLADIVKANRPKPEAAPVSNKSVPVIPTADKAEEAVELVEEKPVEAPVTVQKKEPGRPTVDQAAKKKEMEQIEQLQSLLNNPAKPVVENVKVEPAIAPITPTVIDTTKVEPTVIDAPEVKIPEIKTPEVKTPVVAPKIIKAPDVVKAPEPIKMPEVPKMEEAQSIPEPFTQSAPDVSRVAPSAVAPSQGVRPRGRPRMYPPGQSPTDIKNRERLERKNQLTQILDPENKNILTSPSAAPISNVEKPTEVSAPKPSANVLNRLKNQLNEPSDDVDGDKIDLHKPTIDKPEVGSDKKMTMVLLPKIIPDNLDEVQYRLMKELGHPVKFVTKDNGKDIAKEYIDAGWDIQPMEYKEVEAIEAKNKKNPLEMLDDSEFLASLPRLSNGFFDKGKLINDGGETLQNGKMVIVPSKYPEFQNLDKATRQAVIDKINKLQENPANLIIPVKKEKKDKSENSIEQKLEAPKVEESKVSVPEKSVEKEEDSVSEEEEDMKVYEHGDVVEKLSGKSLADFTPTDFWALVNTREYWDSLPKLPGDKKKYDINLISKFPEVKILEPGALKTFISTIKGVEKGNPLPKYKDKVATVEDSVIKYSHARFYNELQKVAEIEDYGLMAAMMCAYSEEIESYDLKTSMKLLQAAEKLID